MSADPRLQIIAEALGRHYLKERGLKPDGWCVYRPSENGQPARCIETYLEWQVKQRMDEARAVLEALGESGE
jgi:hypothetical protein